MHILLPLIGMFNSERVGFGGEWEIFSDFRNILHKNVPKLSIKIELNLHLIF